ncbi:MAG: hypothetical protein U0350_08695 [Caldilineaceae bacterium]
MKTVASPWTLPAWLQEEAGLATSLTMIALAMGMLALMLIFLPSMHNYTARRFAQNGSDAAAHAAAGKFADDLSINYGSLPNVPYVELSMAWCPSVEVPTLTEVRDQARRRAVELYQLYYGLQVQAAAGPRAEANRYASANSNQLKQFAATVAMTQPNFNYLHTPTNITLYPILVDATTERQFSEWTGSTFQAPGAASAVAYITKVEAVTDTPIPHPWIYDPAAEAEGVLIPCTTWEVMYKYSWEIALVKNRLFGAGLFSLFGGN